MKAAIFTLLSASAFVAAAMSGCHRAPPSASGPLPQRGYLWQRDWSPAVADAAVEAEKHMDGLIILGAEIHWEGGTAHAIRANIPWEVVKSLSKPCAIALRVAPYQGVFAQDDANARAISAVAASLLADAKSHGVALSEFQIDFDCAQKKLAGYDLWLRALRPVVRPMRFVITTLPAWLDEKEFATLACDADGYVLQVHSVPTLEASGHAVLCDTSLARKWVAKAAKLGMPFSVALPTYRCLAGYNPSGKLLGVVMDSVQEAWPPGTQVLEFATDADAVAALVHEWQTARPQALRELLWYRAPVTTDTLNWRWPTLSAVMAGRKPEHKLEVTGEGSNPVDLSLVNNGEAEESFDRSVVVTWDGASPMASDALPGWTLRMDGNRAIFTPDAGHPLRLSPGGRLGIGWLRYEHPTALRCEIAVHDQNPR